MNNDSYVLSLRVYQREYVELAKQEIAMKALSEVSGILFDNNHEWVALRLNIVEPEDWEWDWFDSSPTGAIMPSVKGRIDVYIPPKVPYTMFNYEQEYPFYPIKENETSALNAITTALLSGAKAFLYNFTYESVMNDIDKFCGR